MKPARFALFVLVLSVGAFLAGCDVQQTLDQLANMPVEGPAAPPSSAPAEPPLPPMGEERDTIRVASFNIEVFGTSKMGKPEVMGVLADVVRRFDVVAIQEVRSKDETVVPRFAEMVSAGGARYDFVIGPRLGRSWSKEQYAFLFDTSRIEVDRGSIYTPGDPEDLLHREPLVARFRVRSAAPDQAFTFSLVNIHTDPDETDTELDALDDVFTAVQRNATGEDDVILLGDLNVDERHLGELGALPQIAWVVSGRTTNTRGSKSYDNILFDRRATTEYTGYWGVLDLLGEYNLSLEEALAVSDHLPVWAEFSAWEGAAAPHLVARPDTSAR
jgi:endonuclease/exonuclease/phosphatase family metal-dependent hydrolase